MNSILAVSRSLFEATMMELHRRSEGRRESAALWSGLVEADLWEAKNVHYHHDLCDDRAMPLSIELTESAKLKLYEELALQKQRIVALLHTHPEEWVGLSYIDRCNQVSSRIGFWSIVVPWYGRPPWRVADLGVHERLERGWHQLSENEIESRFIVNGD